MTVMRFKALRHMSWELHLNNALGVNTSGTLYSGRKLNIAGDNIPPGAVLVPQTLHQCGYISRSFRMPLSQLVEKLNNALLH